MILEKYPIRLKNKLLITSLLLLSWQLSAQDKLSAHILQGKAVYDLLSLDSILLEKTEFKYLVGFPKDGYIRLHHAANDSLFQLFKAGKIKEIEDWGAFSMAETSFNTEQELILNTSGWSAWFFDPSLDFHRLDSNSIHQKGAMTFGTKTVRQLYNVATESTTLLEAVKTPIYVVIAQNSQRKKDKVSYYHCCKIVFKP